MPPISAQGRAADARAAARVSIYLAATLFGDGSSSPVKIRNMSATGALVEGAVVPDVGAAVRLVRGRLIASGIVTWAAENRFGLKFSRRIDVQQWRANPANSEQQRVDEIVRLVKAGAVPLPVPPLAQTSLPDEVPNAATDLSQELRCALELLDNLGCILASDSALVMRHGPALQNLDIAMQVIAAVEAIIAGRRDVETDAAKLLGLRRSADQALTQG